MPLYEYRCEDCGKTVEVIQKFSDPPLSECEECKGPLDRLLSPSAVQFKGSGWYVTDYGRKDKTGSSEDSPSKKKKETKGSKSTSDSVKSESSK